MFYLHCLKWISYVYNTIMPKEFCKIYELYPYYRFVPFIYFVVSVFENKITMLLHRWSDSAQKSEQF